MSDNNHRGFETDLRPEVIRKGAYDLGRVNRVPPSVGIFDSPTRCFVVNVDWWSHIAGMVHLLADVVSWKDADDESYFAITEILKFMQGMECMDFSLRQSPDNFCILEQTTDGGTTWTEVFNFALCQAVTEGSSNVINQNTINNYNNALTQFQNTTYNNYVENYVDSITDIHPELGYGDADDHFRDDALCYALGKFIDSVCDSALEVLAESDNVANDLKSSLALVGAVLGILILAGTGIGLPAATIMAASLSAAGIGITAGAAAAIYDKMSEMSESILTDDAAKEELRCCLFGEMADSNADFADLEAALAACTGLGDNANDIRELAMLYAQELALYSAFAETLAIAFQSAKLGLLPECPCEVGTWCFNWNFESDMDTWTLNTGVHPYTEAGVTGVGSTTPNPCIIEIQKPINEYVDNLHINYYGVGSGGNNLKVYNGATLLYDGFMDDFISINQDVTVLKIRTQRGFAYGIAYVELTGTGSNPFGDDNCV